MRRSVQVMNIPSNAIPRIIGRANINAVREATNAHIEVEKISPRREQPTPKIIIKGCADTVRYVYYKFACIYRVLCICTRGLG